MEPGTIRRQILHDHKGKTVTASIGALLASLVTFLPSDYTSAVVPASRSYVDGKITQATKGLPYLVRSNFERDVDGRWFAVYCMHSVDQRGVLDRLIDEYKDVVGEDYKVKTCDQLELMLQIKSQR